MSKLHPARGALFLLGLLVACGGSEPTTPPPPAKTPASIAMLAGNGQIAGPGAAVAINPAVRVLDGSGASLSAVVVRFDVDSGGGAVASSSVSTGSDGTASPGRWTLGSTGPQVLAVTAGNIKVKIRATVQVTNTELTTQTVTAGGGTITVSKPGSPLDGVTFTIPTGAITGSSTISLTEVSTTGMSLPAGVTAVTPAVGIASSVGALRIPALVRFPRAATGSGIAMIAVRNPTTGAFAVLPPVAMDAASITVALTALNGEALPGLRAFSPRFMPMLQDPAGALLFQVAIDPALLARDFDSGFRPGIDDWDFPRRPVASLPFLRGGGQAQSVVDPADGMVATSLWYFVNQRASGGRLSTKLQLQAGEPESNREGIRWSAIATSDVPDLFATGAIATAWEEQITLDAVGFAAAQFTGIKAMFLLGFERPMPVLLFTNADDEAPRLGVAYRVIGNSVDIAVPDRPGASYRATYSAQGMTPFTIVGINDLTYQVRAMAGLSYAMVVKDATLASQWGRVAAGTIGKSEGWPSVELHFEKGKLDTAAVFVADTLRHWWQCDGCPDYGFRPSAVPATASRVQSFRFGTIEGGVFAGLGNMFGSAAFDAKGIPGTGDTYKTGHAIYLPGPGSAGNTPATPGWLDWNTVTYKRMTLRPSPDSLEVGGDTAVTFTVAPTPTPPTGTKYAWVLRTASGRDSVETAAGTQVRNLAAGTEGVLLITALEPVTRRVIGRDSVAITAGGAPFWRITSFTDLDDYLVPDPSEDTQDEAVLRRLLTSPGMGLIAVTQRSPTASDLELRILTSLWDPTAPSPTPARRPGEFDYPLGEIPTVSTPMGSFFAGWDTNFWSQSSTNLNIGTMTGQSRLGLGVWPIKDAGSQVGPMGATRFTATRSGITMSGTIFLWVWYIEESGFVERPAVGYRFPFTATRMR